MAIDSKSQAEVERDRRQGRIQTGAFHSDQAADRHEAGDLPGWHRRGQRGVLGRCRRRRQQLQAAATPFHFFQRHRCGRCWGELGSGRLWTAARARGLACKLDLRPQQRYFVIASFDDRCRVARFPKLLNDLVAQQHRVPEYAAECCQPRQRIRAQACKRIQPAQEHVHAVRDRAAEDFAASGLRFDVGGVPVARERRKAQLLRYVEAAAPEENRLGAQVPTPPTSAEPGVFGVEGPRRLVGIAGIP